TGETVALCVLVDSMLPLERPELVEQAAYRVGATFGALAGALADADPIDLEALLALPEEQRLERAIALARQRGAAVAELPLEMLKREAEIGAGHSQALAEHRATVVEAPLRVIWAEQSLLDGEPATDWSRYSQGG